MDPKVSIIIPFYNCSYVDQAIQSTLNQTYTNIEVIVIDDGSTEFTEKLNQFRRKIIYLKKENGGTATALNLGISTATGEYIAWLSSDDYFLPEKISKQISFMLNHKAEACFTNYDYIDENNNVLVSRNGPRISNVNDIYKEFLNYNAINGCTTIIKKDIFKKNGYFNPDLRYTHDYDMWFRLLLNGYKIHYLDEVLLKFRYHKNSGTNKHPKQIQQEATIVESHYRPLLSKYIEEYL